MDNYENLNAYNKENDYDDINYKNRDDIYDNPLKGEYTNDWTEQLAEPDISYWCQDSPEASTLLGKCIKMLNDKNYKTMKTYLDTLEEYDTDVTVGNSNGERINKVSFVKNFYLGIAFFKEGDYDEALNSFNKAKKLFQYYQLHYNLALCYMKKNNLYEAIINLDSVITKNPNFYFAYYNLIKIYLANRNPSQAYVNYRRLSDLIKKEKEREKNHLDPKERLSITSFNVLKLFYKLGAECSFHLEYHQECVHTILEALKFNPEDAELWCLYGKVFILKKAFEYAKPLLERAIELDNNYEEAKNLLKIINNV